MRASVRIFGGLVIGVVVCFVSAVVVAIVLAVTQTYFSGHNIETFLKREFSRGPIQMSGADIVLVGTSGALGILAMLIWLYATRWTKAEKAAFSGAGIITGAEPAPRRQTFEKPQEPPEAT
jgi:hypothetical protein